MENKISTPFIHHIDESKFILKNISDVSLNDFDSHDAEDLFIIIWNKNPKDKSELNTIYLIPPYRKIDIDLTGMNGYFIAFKRDYLEEDEEEYALDVYNIFNNQGQFTTITISSEIQTNLNHIIELIQYELSIEKGTFLVIKSLLKVVLLHLIRIRQSAFLNQDINQKRVYEFCKLLDEFYTVEKKASFYADRLNISEKRLNQILSDKMNRTITQLIHIRLIQEAKRFLTSGKLSIKEIANHLNFEDQSYFSRFFKKHTGHSPENYKKNAKGVSPLHSLKQARKD
ncbi:helix-turn-helix domain-containing protein [Chryseobacterium sp. PMSZPI]|uniref:helix-turn-helix domain-containing protein n=1 Tax=Chryseobacterium sp. PMSZPI TaxID=1033900 RepID=UPI000C341B45|nr:helix-turn-helix domain-containing protein [Chryseobacterium sp. PMSZPI]PKF74849.1 AraC family transcriptional regulator [Chryseobacterium sp. PMSZPI]